MLVIRDDGQRKLPWCGGALAIGNFDGLHRGHMAVLEAVLHYKRSTGASAAVMTFAPHPRRFFDPTQPVRSIEPMHMRLRRLRRMGFDAVIIRHFTKAFSQMSAQDFMEQELRQRLQVRMVATGDNFIFGHKRTGDTTLLRAFAQAHGIDYQPIAMKSYSDSVFSSSKIREAIMQGDMAHAASLLGRDHEITGIVQHGEKRGRIIGFPTANIALPRVVAPLLGVYAVRFVIGGSEIYDAPDAQVTWHEGVANVGLRPTFGHHEQPRLEVHGFDDLGDIYGRHMRVKLLHCLRKEQKFEGLEALKAQIAHDRQEAQQWLSKQ